MNMPQLTLVSHVLCPFAQRVAIVLNEKNIPYKRIDIDLVNKPDWFLAISPTGKVPVLQVIQDGSVEANLFESIAICEYIEDIHIGHPLHPSDPLIRARHRAWIEFASTMLTDAWGFLTAQQDADALSKASSFRQKLERFEAEYSGEHYFFGSDFSILDAVAAPIFRYFDMVDEQRIRYLFKGLDKIIAWRIALSKRPSVQTAVADNYQEKFHAYLAQHHTLLAAI